MSVYYGSIEPRFEFDDYYVRDGGQGYTPRTNTSFSSGLNPTAPQQPQMPAPTQTQTTFSTNLTSPQTQPEPSSQTGAPQPSSFFNTLNTQQQDTRGYTTPAPTRITDPKSVFTPTQTQQATQTGVSTFFSPNATGSYNTYLSQNPDIAAESRRVVGVDPRFPTLESYLTWHDQNYAYEGRPSQPDSAYQPPAPTGPEPEPVDQAMLDWQAKASDLANRIQSLHSGNFASWDEAENKKRELDRLMAELDNLSKGANSSWDLSPINTARTYSTNILDAYGQAKTSNDALTNFMQQIQAGISNTLANPYRENYDQLIAELDFLDDGIDRYGNLTSEYQRAIELRDRLSSMFEENKGKSAAERQRISDFEANIASQIKALEDEMYGAGIAGIGEKRNDYEKRLRDLNRELMTFQGLLPADLSQETGLLHGAGGLFQELMNRRATEEARLREITGTLQGRQQAVMNALMSADPYDQRRIKMLEAELASLAQQAKGVTSPLGWDAAPITSAIGGAQGHIASLMSQRQQLLGQQRSDFNDIMSRLGSAPEWDEFMLNQLENIFKDEQNQMSRFTGDDLAEFMALIDQGRSAFTDRRTALTQKRSGFETELQDLLSSLEGTRFATLDEVKSKEGQVRSKASDVRRYNAVQAEDEIEALLAMLTGERSRIEGDLKTAAERDKAQAAATRSQIDRHGNLRAGYNPVERDVLTEAQRLAMSRRRSATEQAYAPSAFSSSLGLM